MLKGGGVWNCVPLAVSSAIHFSTCCCTSRRPFSTPFFKFLAFTHSVIAPIASIASTTKYAVVTARTPTAIRSFRKSKFHCHSLNTQIRNINPTAHSARERIRNQSRSSSLTLQIETHSIYAFFTFDFRRSMSGWPHTRESAFKRFTYVHGKTSENLGFVSSNPPVCLFHSIVRRDSEILRWVNYIQQEFIFQEIFLIEPLFFSSRHLEDRSGYRRQTQASGRT